jgi:hypothetical protein
VCQQLGYRGAESATRESFFGPVDGPFAFDDVKCGADEAALDDCRHADVDDCRCRTYGF